MPQNNDTNIAHCVTVQLITSICRLSAVTGERRQQANLQGVSSWHNWMTTVQMNAVNSSCNETIQAYPPGLHAVWAAQNQLCPMANRNRHLSAPL